VDGARACIQVRRPGGSRTVDLLCRGSRLRRAVDPLKIPDSARRRVPSAPRGASRQSVLSFGPVPEVTTRDDDRFGAAAETWSLAKPWMRNSARGGGVDEPRPGCRRGGQPPGR
jgi:hypothetical protein